MNNYDFSGYATRNDLLCEDGRTIRKDAFKDNDGATVPLIWNHNHKDSQAVLGHALFAKMVYTPIVHLMIQRKASMQNN